MDERPVHLELDCSPVKLAISTPLGDDEWAAHRQAEVQGEARVQAEAEQRAAEDARIRELVDAHPDPLVKLLAQRAGLAPSSRAGDAP